MSDIPPRRKIIRIKNYDYSRPGFYFLTLCTQGMRPLFGSIRGKNMQLNLLGKEVWEVWRSLPDHFPSIKLDEFVIMPNHFHGILEIATHESPNAPVVAASPAGAIRELPLRVTHSVSRRSKISLTPKPDLPRSKPMPRSKKFTPAKTPKESNILVSKKQIQHYNAVLIEDLKAEFKFVIDHTKGIEQRLTERMDRTDANNERRFDTIEAILKTHSQLLKQNERRWDENDKRWDENKIKLDKIITQLDQVTEKVERHDQEISDLKPTIS